MNWVSLGLKALTSGDPAFDVVKQILMSYFAYQKAEIRFNASGFVSVSHISV